MFFSVSKLFNFLTDPLTYILLLTFLGILRFKKRSLALTLFAMIYIGSTPFFSQNLLSILENLEQPSDIEDSYEVVVVLSGMVRLDSSNESKIEFGDAVERILKGIELIDSGVSDYLLISGGDGSLMQTNRSEALLLKDFAIRMGVPVEKILIDATSRNTSENAKQSKSILEQKSLKNALLITSAFHMFRAKGCFKANDIVVDVLPVDFRASSGVDNFGDFLPSTPALHDSWIVAHEAIGIITYGVTGKAKYF